MFDDILWLCMNSKGGITYTEAYNMPVAYRLLNIKKISEINKKYNEEVLKSPGKGTSMSMDDLAKPKLDIPDFVLKKGR